MKKVIFTLSLVIGSVIYGATLLYSNMSPAQNSNSVIVTHTANGKISGVDAMVIPANITSEQARILRKAYEIAEADGHENPEIVQAVLLQETMAGGVKNFRVANAGPGQEAYFGVGQIKLAAAKDVLKKWPGLFTKYNIESRSDEEIKANLILNDRFNIEIASKYLLMLQTKYGYTGRKLLNAYNRGPAGVKEVGNDFHYAKGAEAKLAAYKERL